MTLLQWLRYKSCPIVKVMCIEHYKDVWKTMNYLHENNYIRIYKSHWVEMIGIKENIYGESWWNGNNIIMVHYVIGGC